MKRLLIVFILVISLTGCTNIQDKTVIEVVTSEHSSTVTGEKDETPSQFEKDVKPRNEQEEKLYNAINQIDWVNIYELPFLKSQGDLKGEITIKIVDFNCDGLNEIVVSEKSSSETTPINEVLAFNGFSFKSVGGFWGDFSMSMVEKYQDNKVRILYNNQGEQFFRFETLTSNHDGSKYATGVVKIGTYQSTMAVGSFVCMDKDSPEYSYYYIFKSIENVSRHFFETFEYTPKLSEDKSFSVEACMVTKSEFIKYHDNFFNMMSFDKEINSSVPIQYNTENLYFMGDNTNISLSMLSTFERNEIISGILYKEYIK